MVVTVVLSATHVPCTLPTRLLEPELSEDSEEDEDNDDEEDCCVPRRCDDSSESCDTDSIDSTIVMQNARVLILHQKNRYCVVFHHKHNN